MSLWAYASPWGRSQSEPHVRMMAGQTAEMSLAVPCSGDAHGCLRSSWFGQYRLKSATFEFHHPVAHLPETNKIRQATETYEKYLRYYRAALEYTGYPYPYYTIGSAFAVTAQTYRQAGGMGKQQAGEDFYFLQKVFPLGKTHFIDTTCVYPAARVSDRVPFGTGPAIAKMVSEQQFRKLTYQIDAFTELKNLFGRIDELFKQSTSATEQLLQELTPHTRKFLEEEGFVEKITEINRYTGTVANFKKRFFGYFTAFKILKYLNFVHPYPYSLEDVGITSLFFIDI
jgi:hypothetical protein